MLPIQVGWSPFVLVDIFVIHTDKPYFETTSEHTHPLPVIRRTNVHFPSPFTGRPTTKPTLSPSMIPTQNPTANAGAPSLPVLFTGVLPAWQRFRGNNLNSGICPNSLGASKTQMLGPLVPQVKWSRSLVNLADSYEGGGTVSSPIVDASGNIYVTTLDGKLLQFLPNGVANEGYVPTGRSRWYNAVSDVAYAPYDGTFISTPMLNNRQNMLYVGNTDGYLYKFIVNPWSNSNGPVWKFKTNGWVVSSPVQTNSTRLSLIIVGSMDGNVYAVNDGPVSSSKAPTLVWTFPTGRVEYD